MCSCCNKQDKYLSGPKITFIYSYLIHLFLLNWRGYGSLQHHEQSSPCWWSFTRHHWWRHRRSTLAVYSQTNHSVYFPPMWVRIGPEAPWSSETAAAETEEDLKQTDHQLRFCCSAARMKNQNKYLWNKRMSFHQSSNSWIWDLCPGLQDPRAPRPLDQEDGPDL